MSAIRPGSSRISFAPAVICLVLVATSLSGCKKKSGWDWTEHFAVECSVIEDRAEVFVHAADDLPSGAVVEVPVLPGLGDTINNSGVFMTSTSLVPLSAGAHTLTFNASFGEEQATTTCQIERPVFPATANPVKLETEPFARAQIVFSIAADGGEAKQLRSDVALDPDHGAFLLGFKAWSPTKISSQDAALEVDELGVFRVPLDASVGAQTSFSLTNADGHSASYELHLDELRPWVDEDLPVLSSLPESGYEWAAAAKDPRPKGEVISAILLGEHGEVLHHFGPMRVLGEVERVGRVTITEDLLESCEYGTADGTTAVMERVAERAEVVLHVAKSGTQLTTKQHKQGPGRCPDAADFTVMKSEGDDKDVAFDQRLVGEVLPKVIEWFETASQR